MKQEFSTLNELIKELSPYLNQSALARICKIDESQMRQYKTGIRNPTQKTIDEINKRLNEFGEELKGMRIEKS